MKKPTTLLLFLFLFSMLSAQYIPNNRFSELHTITCPYDEFSSVTVPESWTIYQTLNNAWDGPIDSTQCIQVYEEGNATVLRLNEINLERPIFIRNLFDTSENPLLNPNSLYNVTVNLDDKSSDFLALGDTCTNGLCSGIMVGIEIPDSTGQGKALRTYSLNANDNVPFGGSTIQQCIPTEKFTKNYLKEIIFKLSFPKDLQTNETFSLGDIWFEESYLTIEVDKFIAPENTYNGSSYDLGIRQAIPGSSFGYNYLLKYQGSTYPSTPYLSYVEAAPEINADVPSVINLTIPEEATLVPQPFTSMRGALVEGDSSQRHEFNLIDMGGNICIAIVELVFDGSSNFIYHSGKVELTGSSACMQFINGARLEVAKDAHLEYGSKGEGALALGKNSTILLRENSSIHINNDLVLLEKSNAEEEQVYIQLHPGNVLSFGEKARLWKHTKVKGGSMHLNVLMNGGVLDDQNLSAYGKTFIRRIYPQVRTELKDNILIQQNPVAETLGFQVLCRPDEALSLALYSQEGVLIWSREQLAVEGYNSFEVPMHHYSGGLYFLQVKTGKEYAVQKIIKR